MARGLEQTLTERPTNRLAFTANCSSPDHQKLVIIAHKMSALAHLSMFVYLVKVQRLSYLATTKYKSSSSDDLGLPLGPYKEPLLAL